MRLGYQLVLRVCVGARGTIFAVLIHGDISAHFGFLHLFNFLIEFKSFFLAVELLLLG